jgi:PAS domain S-box-containing protein
MPKLRKRDINRILAKVTDAFVAFDREGRYSYLSEEAATLTGLPARALVGRKFTEAYPQYRANIFYRKYRDAVRTKKKLSFEHYYPILQKWFAITIYPTRTGAATAYFKEITDVKTVEANLKKTREEAQLVLDHIKDYAIFILDPKGHVQTWNPGAARIHGYAAHEILGKHIRTFYPPDGQATKEAEKELAEAAEKGRSEREGMRIRKDGTPFWSNAIVRAMHDADGTLTGFIKVTRDITERKQAQDMVDERTFDLELNRDLIERDKAHDEALLNSIGEGVIATDADGNIVLINQQAQLMLGIPESRALGRHFGKVWHIENDAGERLAPEEYPIYTALHGGKKVRSSDHWYYSHPHNRFPAAATASPIIFNKKIIGAVVVLRNITKERETDRAKSEFVSLVSHQLRTPLTAIKLFAEMLARGGLGTLTPQQREVIRNIDTSNDKMINLVNALLNVSRIESGRLRPKPEPVDLPRMIEEIVTETQGVARAKHCTIRFRLPPNTDFPLVTTDPSLFRQVIANLVNNAVQYSPARRVVTVALQKRPEQYVVSVKDQGIGIPKNDRPRIFERFYRTAGAVKKKTDGTGLGLYMSKMIVELLGGKIWFRSQERKGSVFSVSIPLAVADQPLKPPRPRTRRTTTKKSPAKK